ncbi:MAG: hypothetical protein JSW60_07445 [Thermoplasmatales archaeon]|nr:MAG: hypothetical protein JSW60_07445 [Thermoplasmatales archaeon]
MIKWKLFSKSKSKKEEKSKEVEIPVQKSEEVPQPEAINETKEETEELPTKDYHETLYSEGQAPKKTTISPKPSEKAWTPKRWESPQAVEKNVDDIGKKKDYHTEKYPKSSDINKKVDRLLWKKKQ